MSLAHKLGLRPSGALGANDRLRTSNWLPAGRKQAQRIDAEHAGFQIAPIVG